MKPLIGIDSEHRYSAAMSLLGRLRFPDAPQWLLVHAREPFAVMDWTLGLQPVALNDADESDRILSTTILDKASDEACGHGARSVVRMPIGGAAGVLLREADENGVDLIAVGSHERGALGSAFLGSVSRALTIGAKQSVLIGKGKVGPQGPVDAIFATDHSPYAERCLQRLLDFKPAGLRKILVLSAYAVPSNNLGNELRDIENAVREKCAMAVAKLEGAGYQAEYKMLPGDPNDAIEHEMRRTSADLLILGAQGHGFVERLLVGSVALHQAVSTPHSVLILRA